MDDNTQARGAVAARRAIRDCQKCSLRGEATRPIPWDGPLNPDFAVLGEAPGRTEDREGRPFVGPAGHLLKSLLDKNEIPSATVTFLNAANCYPSKTRTPTREHLDKCLIHLAGQIAAVAPTNLLVVGTTALAALIGDHAPMKAVRARPFWLERLMPFAPFSRPVVCWATYHPAAGLRSSTYRLKIEEDVERWAKWVKNKDIFPGDCVKCGKEVDSWDQYGFAWCADHSGKQGVLI